PEEEVAGEPVGDVLYLAGTADVLDVLRQHDLHADSSLVPTTRGRRRPRQRAAAPPIPSRAAPTADRKSRSTRLSPRSSACRRSRTSSSGQASTKTLTASTPKIGRAHV